MGVFMKKKEERNIKKGKNEKLPLLSVLVMKIPTFIPNINRYMTQRVRVTFLYTTLSNKNTLLVFRDRIILIGPFELKIICYY